MDELFNAQLTIVRPGMVLQDLIDPVEICVGGHQSEHEHHAEMNDLLFLHLGNFINLHHWLLSPLDLGQGEGLAALGKTTGTQDSRFGLLGLLGLLEFILPKISAVLEILTFALERLEFFLHLIFEVDPIFDEGIDFLDLVENLLLLFPKWVS